MIDGSNTAKIYSIKEISNLIRATVENNFSHVSIKAELTSITRHNSGHVYFTLKDDDCVLDGICWRSKATSLPASLQEGAEVICAGRITTYPGRSKYQIIASKMTLSGEGELLRLLEQLKKQLSQEGLFENHHKKPLPILPQTIGVITSATGAVIRDILHRVQDRFPTHILLWSTNVQGETTASEICTAIEGFNNITDDIPCNKPDLIIIARGGGSLEDLWAFNSEQIVRAIFASRIPIISAIGHETDTTLVDFVADYRAPTPTAAAEKAVPVRQDLLHTIKNMHEQSNRLFRRIYEDKMQKYDDLSYKLKIGMKSYLQEKTHRLDKQRLYAPKDLLLLKSKQVSFISKKLDLIINYSLNNYQNKLLNMGKLLHNCSYENVLKRGFCLIKKSQSQSLVTSVKQLCKNDDVHLVFGDGSHKAKITD